MKDKGKRIDKDGKIVCEWKLPKEKKCRYPFGYCPYWLFCDNEGINYFPFDTKDIEGPKEYIMSQENIKRMMKWFYDV